MRGHNDWDSELLALIENKFANIFGYIGVKRGRRLVKQQNAGEIEKGFRQINSSQLASRQGADSLIIKIFELKQFNNILKPLFTIINRIEIRKILKILPNSQVPG